MTLAAQRPEPNIALAVDARNSPALALYEHAGFCALRRREAFVAHPAPYAISPAPVK
jgi:ribosomal protein S18 acetylase RimI-like enzyme